MDMLIGLRENGSELVMNRLDKLLIREADSTRYKEEFDEADSVLSNLIRMYPRRIYPREWLD